MGHDPLWHTLRQLCLRAPFTICHSSRTFNEFAFVSLLVVPLSGSAGKNQPNAQIVTLKRKIIGNKANENSKRQVTDENEYCGVGYALLRRFNSLKEIIYILSRIPLCVFPNRVAAVFYSSAISQTAEVNACATTAALCNYSR